MVRISLLLVGMLFLSALPVVSADVSETLTIDETIKVTEKSYNLPTKLAQLTITAELTTASSDRYYTWVEVCYNLGSYDDCFSVGSEEPYQSIKVVVSGDSVNIRVQGYTDQAFQYTATVDIVIKDKNGSSLYLIASIPFVILAIAIIQALISKSKASQQ